MLFTAGEIECSPADVGYDESRIEALHRHFQRLMDENKIQCASYCVSRHGKIFMYGAVGPKSFEDPSIPLQPDSINFIASMTKPFTATAIMQLVENGLTRLDVTVGSILPEFANPPFDTITIVQLLTHTAGLPPDEGCFPNEYELSPWDAISGGFNLHKPDSDKPFDWIAAVLSLGLRDKPGKQWMYSTIGYAILGAIIEKLTGVFAHTYIEENIIKPLGLKDTFFTPPVDKLDRYIVSRDFDRRLKDLREELTGVTTPTPEDQMWYTIPATGHGLSSTPYDFNRFGNAFLNGGRLDGARILGRKTVEKMTTVASALPNYCWGADGTRRLYGVGFDMIDTVQFTYSKGTFSHEGWGYVDLIIDKQEEMVSAVFVPFADPDTFQPEALYGTQNVIWSGLV